MSQNHKKDYRVNIFFKIVLSTIFFTVLLPTASQAQDLFASSKQTITDSFGKGSSVVYILYILEILAAVFAYIKTKNLVVFGGIAAVILFINVATGLITV